MYAAEGRRYRCEHQCEQKQNGDVGAAQHRHVQSTNSVYRAETSLRRE
jgi:hypothetical protein